MLSESNLSPWTGIDSEKYNMSSLALISFFHEHGSCDRKGFTERSSYTILSMIFRGHWNDAIVYDNGNISPWNVQDSQMVIGINEPGFYFGWYITASLSCIFLFSSFIKYNSIGTYCLLGLGTSMSIEKQTNCVTTAMPVKNPCFQLVKNNHNKTYKAITFPNGQIHLTC